MLTTYEYVTQSEVLSHNKAEVVAYHYLSLWNNDIKTLLCCCVFHVFVDGFVHTVKSVRIRRINHKRTDDVAMLGQSWRFKKK